MNGDGHRHFAAADRDGSDASLAGASLHEASPGGVRRYDPINILVVDDEPKNLTVLESVLDDPSYHIVRAESADQALLALIEEQFALLILDVRMPGMTGLELAQLVKNRRKTAQIPIIFLTAYYREDEHVLEGYGAGGVDYLQKPVNASILRSKVAVFAELFRKNRDAILSGQALLAEVTERRRVEAQLRELNETLEYRVASRTAELVESRARLRHAADLAKLTYFDLDYVRDRIQIADNFADIMGFSMAGLDQGEGAVGVGRKLMREHVASADRARFVAATENLEGGLLRKIEYRVFGDDGKERWIESEWRLEVGPDGAPHRAFAAHLDITERKQSEEQKKILLMEINHRSKNLLAVIQALVNQSVIYGDPATFAIDISDRLQGLSASQDLLIESDWQGIQVSELVLAQLRHFNGLVGTRILLDGPAARFTAAGAQSMGMALHELATNAVKHGALSTSEGRVHINWTISTGMEPLFSMQWIEEGGAPVSAPARKGFGHLVIGRIVESALGGNVQLEFPETGLTWRFCAPARDSLEL